MIIQCPYCATRYELDAARMAGPNPMFKCSRCRHVFPPSPPKQRTPAPAAAPASVKSRASSEESLALPFDSTRGNEPAESAPGDLTVPETEEEFTLGTEEHPVQLTVPDDVEPDAPSPHAPALTRDAAPDEPTELGAGLSPEDEIEIEEEAPKRARRPRTPRPRERSHVVPLFVFLGLVVTGYGVLTSTLFANPALSDKLVGRIPLIGTLGDERLLVRKVALSDVVSSYQRIKDGKDVLVITGKALNTAPVALQGVQIAGKLFDNSGAPVDEKVISCGNVISTKVLKDLTPQEVSILQKLSPPKKFVIEPGESSTFVIVFMDPPRQAVEFTTQVVAAQRQT
ncbi:MAG TPA: DUF3426 domain-containing protein [Candidatus Margulisiibacteriota bacterium]|nr:DUF3426 domain-containing protein [Candidatus Margulisiibacteriota bacterium]